MKTFVYTLFATLIFALSGNAQKTESAELKITAGKTVSSYKFASVREFQSQSEPILTAAIRAHIAVAGSEPGCSILVSMTITGSSGGSSITVTGTITVPCSQALAASIQLRDQLIQAILDGD